MTDTAGTPAVLDAVGLLDTPTVVDIAGLLDTPTVADIAGLLGTPTVADIADLLDTPTVANIVNIGDSAEYTAWNQADRAVILVYTYFLCLDRTRSNPSNEYTYLFLQTVTRSIMCEPDYSVPASCKKLV